MKLQELKKLIDTLEEQKLETDVCVSFLMNDKIKTLDFLNIIKNLNYPAFIRSTSLGTEVCVVDEQQN